MYETAVNEKDLVENILGGNKESFRVFIEQYQKLVSHVVFRMISGDADREDICQDVFVKVYLNLKNFRYDSKLSTWVAKIAYNTALNYLDKKKLPLYGDFSDEERKVEEAIAENTTPEDYAGEREISRKVVEEIDAMPVIYGTILSLYHLEEMSYREIGDIMKLPDGTVKSYLYRARRMLKERLLRKYQREDL
ncbi:MAG: sigma-70 family RNA polymerase sigma factor [candidate division Zixibacteria bacterium]|nr:sigma-70 family RNA polymerase sigma factor [candidate division Zixibacteria bacterium]